MQNSNISDPLLNVGDILKDCGENLWIVTQANHKPTYLLNQLWAGTAKSICTINKRSGDWENLNSGNNILTLLTDKK